METYLNAILGVVIVSLLPLFGLLVMLFNREKVEKTVNFFVCFAVGALLGNSVLHIIPELFEEGLDSLSVSLSIIFGILLFYALEQFLRWRHCHKPSSKEHFHPVGIMSQVGDTLHNFIDGILIATSFVISPALGWSTVTAVIFHEIPQEIADFGVLLYAKWSIKKIVIFNVISGLFALLGLVIGFWLSSYFEVFALYAIGATAGGFLYIACTDLLPSLHSNGGESLKDRILQFLFIVIGIGVFLII